MKNLLKVIFIGAMLGIVVLMLSYLGIYYVEGQGIYEQEILQLTQADILQNQLIVGAFYGALFVTEIFILTELTKNENKQFYKPILASIVLILAEFIFVFSIYYIGQFSDNIKMMIVIISHFVFGIYALVMCVKLFLEEFFINKKIKEKNLQEPEKGN